MRYSEATLEYPNPVKTYPNPGEEGKSLGFTTKSDEPQFATDES